MAGGKETPRQKMIGMMYLVLTALLALQIKDKVLDKFVLIEEGLELSNDVYENANSKGVTDIQKAFSDLGNSDKDRPVVDAALKVRSETAEIVKYIEEWKDRVIEHSGGREADNSIARSTLKKYEEPSFLLYEKKGGDTLKTRLDGYTNSVMSTANAVLGERGIPTLNWESLALDAKDIELYAKDPDEKNKDFKELNFYKTPLASVLSQLTFFQNQIYAHEAEALGKLGGALGASNIKGFDVITPTVLPYNNIVTAGTEFEADVFLTASSSSLTPSMTGNGKDLEVDGNGRGKLKFRATGGAYNKDGLAKKVLKGSITYKQDGEDITREYAHEYFVAQPLIEVRSEAIETLYLNCANKLQINVPSLGAAYNPSFSATGGRAMSGAQKGALTVVPNASEVAITVSSSGTRIGTKKFKVDAVPRPSLQVKPDGRNYDATKGLRSSPRSIRLSLVPDENFAKKYPEDAKFAVSKGRVVLASGQNAKEQISISKPTIDLNLSSSFRGKVAKGDRIVIVIDEVVRIDFEGKPHVIPFKKDSQLNIN